MIEGIIRKYERHPSILKFKNNFVSSITFDFPKTEVADIFLFYFIFSIGGFFYDQSRITGQQGKGENISLTPYYHFHR